MSLDPLYFSKPQFKELPLWSKIGRIFGHIFVAVVGLVVFGAFVGLLASIRHGF